MVLKFKLDNSQSDAAKETISRTLNIANNYAGELTIEVLPLDTIELDPDNNRDLTLTLEDAIKGIDPNDPELNKKKQDIKSLETLAKTIKDDQLINPIFVYRFGNKCRLIAGERRTLASALAGKKEIIARIAPERPLGTKLRVLQWIENNERSDLSLSERISSIEAIITEFKKENKDVERVSARIISDLTGMSETQSRRYMMILQSPPEIRKAISESKLDNVKLLELILSVNNEEHQNKILNAALSNASFNEINALKSKLENKTKKRKQLVSLGQAKPTAVKIIVEALITSKLNKNLIAEIKLIQNKLEWSNEKSIQSSFKKIISLISEEVAG